MSKISRTDRIIGVVLVSVLLILLGVALGRRGVGRHGTAGASPPPVSGTPTTVHSGTGVSPTTPGGTDTIPTADAPTTSTTTTVATSSGAPGTAPVPGPVSAVGDSIMLDIQSDLQADIPGVRVDGLVSRQFETGVGIVQADRAAGTLGNVLVVELGTNGTVTPADFTAMMQAAAGVKRVVFVNVDVPRSWEAPDNAVLAAGVAQYPGVAVLADWYSLSTAHPEWFTPDQVHLEPAGAQALATLITSKA
jgi:hypothetical protein